MSVHVARVACIYPGRGDPLCFFMVLGIYRPCLVRYDTLLHVGHVALLFKRGFHALVSLVMNGGMIATVHAVIVVMIALVLDCWVMLVLLEHGPNASIYPISAIRHHVVWARVRAQTPRIRVIPPIT